MTDMNKGGSKPRKRVKMSEIVLTDSCVNGVSLWHFKDVKPIDVSYQRQFCIKMKNKIYHIVRTLPKYN